MKCPLLPALAALLCLGSCTVYTPLQPSLTSIRNRGEAEFRLSLQPTLRPEASATYSPARYLLVSAAGSWRPQLALPDTSLYRVQAGEASLGGYWPLNEKVNLIGMMGLGAGQAARRISVGKVLGNYGADFTARYQTQFGQLGVMARHHHLSFGLGYRLTQVNFRALSTPDFNLPLETQLRHEPFATLRTELGGSPGRRWQLELSGGLSIAQRGRGSDAPLANPLYRQIDLNRGTAMTLSMGLVYYLHKQPRD